MGRLAAGSVVIDRRHIGVSCVLMITVRSIVSRVDNEVIKGTL